MKRSLAAVAVAAAVLGASPARAIEVAADVGGGVWLLEATQFDFHVRVEQKLFDWIRLGIRPGLALTLNEPNPRLGIPLDGLVRLKVFVFYFDVLGGIFLIPSHVQPVRTHLAGGFGLKIWRLEAGVEVAYLSPSVSILGRVGFSIWQPGEKKTEEEK